MKYLIVALLVFPLSDLINDYFFVPNLALITIGISSLFVLTYIYRYLLIRSIKYDISEDQLNYTRGVFSIRTDYIELYRVKDFSKTRSFVLRIINAMSITLDTSDKSHPRFHMIGIPKSNLLETLRDLVEQARIDKRVFEVD